MVRWTAEDDQRIFLIVVDLVKLDHNAIAKEWAKRYGGQNGENVRTASAIMQHINQLKGKMGGKSTSANGTLNKAPATPKKPAVPKTPTSSAKRKQVTMSEEDDSEPDMAKAGLSQDSKRRKSLSRGSKSASKKYEDPDSDDGDDEADGIVTKKENGNDSSIFDGVISFDVMAEAQPICKSFQSFDGFSGANGDRTLSTNGGFVNGAGPSKKQSNFVDLADESDVSNFEDTFN